MAARVVGFFFDDRSFFNSAITEDEYRLLTGENGTFYSQTIAGIHASSAGIHLTSKFVEQVVEDGYTQAANLDQLYRNGVTDVPAAPASSQAETEDSQLSKTENKISGSYNWTHSSTLLLIEEYRDNQSLFSNSSVKKKEVWTRISKKMTAKGYAVSGDVCDKKFRSLKYRYKQICDSHHQTGRGRRRWDFFDILDDLFAGDPAVRPAITISSLTSQDHNNSHDAISPSTTSENLLQETITSTPSTSTSTPSTSTSTPSTSTSTPSTCTSTPSTCTSTPSTSTRRPAAGENSAPPKKKRKNQKDPPEWFQKFAAQQNKRLDELKEIAAERNSLFRELIEVIKHNKSS